jgi:GNAT superfamily N-acetyltransferase
VSLEIVAFSDEHMEDAAALVTNRYRTLRGGVPDLPVRYEDGTVVEPMIRNLAGHCPGVAALRGGSLEGFLLAMVIPEWRGRRSVWSPEWANAAELEDRAVIYRAMYAHLSEQWVDDGSLTHLVSLLAHDREALDAWHWSGFGMAAVDAVRHLSPVKESVEPIDIRRAGVEDVEIVMELDQALHDYLAGAPIFLYDEEQEGQAYHEAWLANPNLALWLAFSGSKPVAYMTIGPANDDACDIIQDPGTSSILGALTRATVRGTGIGTLLLNRSLQWARESGYERCAVDFEPENVDGSRFWMRHFRPVCYSLVRQVDVRFI